MKTILWTIPLPKTNCNLPVSRAFPGSKSNPLVKGRQNGPYFYNHVELRVPGPVKKKGSRDEKQVATGLISWGAASGLKMKKQ